jgi:hypothetical protein
MRLFVSLGIVVVVGLAAGSIIGSILGAGVYFGSIPGAVVAVAVFAWRRSEMGVPVVGTSSTDLLQERSPSRLDPLP